MLWDNNVESVIYNIEEGFFKFVSVLSRTHSTTTLHFCQKFWGTVVGEKLLVLIISKSELGPSVQQKGLRGSQSLSHDNSKLSNEAFKPDHTERQLV